MLYRTLGKTGIKISAVSFGSMRWPSEEECELIVARGVEHGLNYVDTSTGYCGGQSEVWTGRAAARRRDRIFVSNKTRYAAAPRADEVRRAIEKSLQAMGLDYLDFYQLWGLETMEVLQASLRKGGFVDGVRQAQRDGLVRHGLGFTFHGAPETFRAAVDTGEFVSATVSYNLLNRREAENIAYAAAKGMGVIVMNPLAGGVLALAGLPALNFLRAPGAGQERGALRFLAAHREITTAIVGYRSAAEVDQAAAAMKGAGRLGDAYRARLERRMEGVRLLEGTFCTGCGYCKECPSGVNVPKYMQTMRDFEVYGVAHERLADWIWSKYAHADPVKQLAACTACGRCESKCPQHLAIIAAIRRGREALAAHSAVGTAPAQPSHRKPQGN
jgi:predicted aldo/keto reductase-like oxidoreductase